MKPRMIYQLMSKHGAKGLGISGNFGRSDLVLAFLNGFLIPLEAGNFYRYART